MALKKIQYDVRLLSTEKMLQGKADIDTILVNDGFQDLIPEPTVGE